MKRFYISLIIIALLCGITVFSHILVKDTADTMLESIEKIGLLCDNGSFTLAEEEITRLEDFCRRREHTTALFIKRDYVSAVIVSCSAFRAYAKPGSEPDLHAELDRAKNQIEVTRHLFFSIV